MPPTRHEYNSKARGSSAGTRKKGKLKKDKQAAKTDEVDPNAEIIAPKSTQEKDSDRRERLREELRAQSDNWSSKKKKRLEKYIDKKLKKEQRILIYEKLAKSQDGVASSYLQSSSTLGTGKTFSHKEWLEKHEDLQVKHAMQGKTGKRKRHSGIAEFIDGSYDSRDEDEEHSASDVEPDDGPQRTHVQLPLEDAQLHALDLTRIDEPQKPLVAQPVVVGTALRRNDDGTIAVSVIRGKTPKSGVGKWKASRFPKTAIESDSNTSFDSSDSASDTASEVDEKGNGKEAESRSSHMQGEGEDTDSQEYDSSGDEGEKEEQLQKTNKIEFKAWATKQLSLAKSYIADPTNRNEVPPQPVPAPLERATKRRKLDETEKMRGPMGEELVLPSSAFAQQVLKMGSTKSAKKFIVKRTKINRPPDVEAARLQLPIVSEEQPIMEAVMLNPVVIICGETGSGKTTQVPQFLYEAGFGNPDSENPGNIGITQPRRVAAISMASRVAHELSLTSSHVSYQVRYDATVSPSTSIKFMTDGVLLRELATDFLLSKYSVIIIDEAHERSINTDILIGVLSRIVKLREEMWKEHKEGARPLRLVIMSATLRVSDFLENRSLFPVSPPVINVDTRQHPVTIHFSRKTSADYLAEAVKKAFKIHARLPPGGILIFLTGQNDITGVCRRLEERYGRRALQKRSDQRDNHSAPTQHTRDFEIKAVINPNTADLEPEDIDLDAEDHAQRSAILYETTGSEDEDDIGSEAGEDFDEELSDSPETEVPMHIIPLYSLLPSEKQMEVFKPPPADARLVVVATNVAETSLTIPGIKYVIDCGRVKERRYDVANGIQAFQVTWVSKASAAQRAGRAGRTGPGHCYRLYSSALFEDHFPQFNPPEILRAPVEGVVLQMKNMHIDAVVNFPFPTPPDRPALQRAENLLLHLGALTKSTTVSSQLGPVISQVTDLGRTMALFPVSPRFARMLAAGQQHQCLPYAIAIVSAMSVGDPFLYEAAIGADNDTREDADEDLHSEAAKAKELRRQRRRTYFQNQHAHASLGDYTSDVLKVLSVVGAYEYQGGGVKFCADNFVRHKAMEEIHKLRAQITSIVQSYFPATNVQFSPKLSPPSNMQIKVLKQLITAAFIDQVAIRKDLIDHNRSLGGSQYGSSHGVPYRAVGVTEDVFMHPSSVLSERPPPDFVVFQEVVRTSRVFIKGVTIVNPAWLSSLGGSTLCSYSKPFTGAGGVLFVTPRFGPEGWELPAVKARKN